MSDHFTVNVHPGQIIQVILDQAAYVNSKVEMVGSLNLESKEVISGREVYSFSHPVNTYAWSDYSNTQLGEICILSDGICSKLQVVLRCTNPVKNNHVAIINPHLSDLKIKPFEVVEVVVFDTNFYGGNDEWTWQWSPAYNNIKMDEMGNTHLSHYMWTNYCGYLDDDDPDYRYSTCLRIPTPPYNMSFRQHHFWFRLSSGIFSCLKAASSVQHVGTMTLCGVPCRWKKCFDNHTVFKNFELYVDLNTVYKDKIIETLNLEKKKDFSPYTYQYRSLSDYGNHPLRNLPQQCKIDQTIMTQLNSSRPIKRDVVAKRLETDSLSEGCRVLSSDDPIFETYRMSQYEVNS